MKHFKKWKKIFSRRGKLHYVTLVKSYKLNWSGNYAKVDLKKKKSVEMIKFASPYTYDTHKNYPFFLTLTKYKGHLSSLFLKLSNI